MKTQNNIFKTVSFLAIASLFSFNTFAQPQPGTPNENAGDNPWTNNGNKGNGNGNSGNNGNGNSGNNGNGNGNSGNNGNGNSGNNGNGNGNSGNNGNNGNGNTGSENSNTQPSTNKTSSTSTLNVTVGEFYSINLSNENATILLDTEAKFTTGSESTPITMTIFSSRKYAVNAQVSSEDFSGVTEGTTVKTNNIDLLVSKVTESSQITITDRSNKSLKHSTAEEIVTSTKASKADVYNLVYSIPATNTAAFLNQFGKTINTQITYTLLPL